LPEGAKIEMPEQIRKDMSRFLELAEADKTLNPKDLDVPLTREEAIALLRSAYGEMQ